MTKRMLHRLACLMAVSLVLMAQSDTAVFFGVVKDPTGAAIPNAKVTISNSGTSLKRELVTSDKGLFYFSVLPPGNYTVDVGADGFKQVRDRQVQLQVAQISRLDITLPLGNVTESVDVESQVSPLSTESVSQGTVISQEKLPALPLNGRQFLQLALLVPGANPGGRAVQQNSVRMGQIGGLSIAGGRTNNTQFMLDGAINIDPDYSSLNYSPAVDSVAEFQVQTAMVSAQYGRASVNVVTKSGSSQIHGAAWEFLRNREFDARPFNLPGSLPQYQRNQFGANMGGPAIKSKLFYFGSFEGLRVRQAGAGLTNVNVPTALQRDGNFSTTPGGIFDPDTLANGVRTPFPNNTIPATRINAMSKAGMLALPLPNSTGNTFVNYSGVLKQNNNNYSGRMDWNATSKWNMFGRYSISEEIGTNPQRISNRDDANNARSQNATLGSTYVIRPNLLNETRIGFSRLHVLTGLQEPIFDVNGQKTVLPQFNVANYPLFGGAGQFTGASGGGLLQVRNTTYQIYDNVSWNRGAHVVKFGGEIVQLRYGRIETPSTLGNFQFTQGFTTRTARTDGTGDALATFLLGMPAIANRSVGPNRADAYQNVASLYAQDDIRVRHNLTVNLGVRYELAPPAYEINSRFSSIDYSTAPTPGQIFAEGRTGFYKPQMFVCGQSGTPRGCAFTDRNNFAPRVGVVWSPTEKTVVRVGGGIFYANSDVNPLFRLAAGLPANISQTLNSDNFIPRFRGYDIFGVPAVGSVQIQAAGIDMGQRSSYTAQWNAAVQRQVSRDITFEVGYLATSAFKLEQNVQPNNARAGLGAVDPRRPYAGLTYAPGTTFPNYLQVVSDSVPVGFINYLPHSAQSNYHSGYLRIEKRFSKGLSFLSSYTFAKAITNAPQFRNAGGVNGSENSPPQDSFNLAAERGLASFHLAHRAVNTFLYDLPFGKGAKYVTQGIGAKVLGGMHLSGIYTLQTGFPFTVNLRGDTAGVGAGTGGIFVRPNAVPGASEFSGSQRSANQWFNTAAYLTPATGTFGNVGRNTVIGPGLANLDMVVTKVVPIQERVTLEFRLEVFNVANTPNFNVIGRILNDPTFGRALSQSDPRQIQLGLKANF